MGAAEEFLLAHPWLAWVFMPVWFAVLAKSAGLFVDSAVALAHRLNVPKLVIGILLVSLATTAPELVVSLMAALRGKPEIALGNAIGSVICDDGLALPLAGLFAAAPIAVMPGVLKTSGTFLFFVQLLLFFFVFRDHMLTRGEGIVLVLCFAGYVSLLYRQHKAGKLRDDFETEPPKEFEALSAWKTSLLFLAGLAGILVAAEGIVLSATAAAASLGVSEAVIALSLVAFGTSIPEIATCVSAARKGHGAIAVGNILGADILNICWVAGVSAIANPLVLTPRVVRFSLPSMFIFVGVMLLLLRHKYRMTKAKAFVLLGMYAAYLVTMVVLFPPER